MQPGKKERLRTICPKCKTYRLKKYTTEDTVTVKCNPCGYERVRML